MRKQIIIVVWCIFFQSVFIVPVVVGQIIVYSNKPFGITLNFPTGWQMLNGQEIELLGSQTTAEVKLDSETRTYVNDIAIIAIALEKRIDPKYTLQILSEKFTSDSKDKSSEEFLLQGIRYMQQQGIKVTKYTAPALYNTRNDFTFITSKMEIMTDGQIHFEKNYIIKRQNDFLIISGSFLDKNNDSWLEAVVNSISLNQ